MVAATVVVVPLLLPMAAFKKAVALPCGNGCGVAGGEGGMAEVADEVGVPARGPAVPGVPTARSPVVIHSGIAEGSTLPERRRGCADKGFAVMALLSRWLWLWLWLLLLLLLSTGWVRKGVVDPA